MEGYTREQLVAIIVDQSRVIAWLHVTGRVPLRGIQSLLLGVYGLRISLGELAEVLHTVAACGKPLYESLGEAVRMCSYAHAYETGWREDGVAKVYHKARAFVSQKAREPSGTYRARTHGANARVSFQEQAIALARPIVDKNVPQRVLAKRIETFLPELFTFVEYPQAPSENNVAERAIRPCVIARKVSGGTRSSKGSQTRMILMSLFGTWRVQNLDLLDACRHMLEGTNPQPA